jgi:hypothetical protein
VFLTDAGTLALAPQPCVRALRGLSPDFVADLAGKDIRAAVREQSTAKHFGKPPGPARRFCFLRARSAQALIASPILFAFDGKIFRPRFTKASFDGHRHAA